MLSHVDKANNPTMVDVSSKSVTTRTATAQACIDMPPELDALVQDGDSISKKGPVFHKADRYRWQLFWRILQPKDRVRVAC